MKMKKIYYVLIAILLLLVITNPSVKAFKDYLGYDNYAGLKRQYNFFACSIYKHGTSSYFAIIGNFFRLSPAKPIISSDSTKSDSGKMDSTVLIDTMTLPPAPPRGSITVRKRDTTADDLPIFRKKLLLDAFAKKIRDKYPVYNGIDNKTLVNKFITKYPKYRDSVSF